jgi:NTE family protein
MDIQLNHANLETSPYNLGFVLSGGGAKGFAHIGAMKSLAEHGLRPDIISGVSAGAILGAFFCDGYEADEVLEICSKEKFTTLAEFTIPKSGILTLNGLKRFLKKNLRAKTFEELKTPLVVTATDFDLCQTVHFDSGNLADAICASSSIPVVFSPWEMNGKSFVDGGVLSNLPVLPIRHVCRHIIGINATGHLGPDYKKTLMGVSERAFRLMMKANTYIERNLCDIYIESEEEKYYSIFNIENIREISQLGYNASHKALKDIDVKRISR